MSTRAEKSVPGPLRPNVVEVAERLGVDRTTVTRWITKGARPARRSGPAAKSIRLAAIRLPSGWVVRDEDLQAFQEQLTAAWMVPTVAETLVPPGERSRQVRRDMEDLRRLGLC